MKPYVNQGWSFISIRVCVWLSECTQVRIKSTGIGIDQGVGFSLDSSCRPCVLIDLLHRVEVDGVNSTKCGEANLVLAVLMRRLIKRQKSTYLHKQLLSPT